MLLLQQQQRPEREKFAPKIPHQSCKKKTLPTIPLAWALSRVLFPKGTTGRGG